MHYSLHYAYNNYNYNLPAMCETVGACENHFGGGIA